MVCIAATQGSKRMARGNGVGKSIVLLLLIVALVLSGLIWFDHLGIIRVSHVFAPIYRIFGAKTAEAAVLPSHLTSDIDQERINKQRESLDLYKEELDKRDADLTESEKTNAQIAAELAEREKSQEEREKTFNEAKEKYDKKEVNIEQIAANLNGMQPKAAVDILVAMDDQLVIDVLRKVEEIAQESGTASMGSYWLSLMPADRAATIQRKLVSKPKSLE